ncbi:hypothetical protein ACGE0T_18980 [Parabacteroides sp. APC149_11_2_Y6]
MKTKLQTESTKILMVGIIYWLTLGGGLQLEVIEYSVFRPEQFYLFFS